LVGVVASGLAVASLAFLGGLAVLVAKACRRAAWLAGQGVVGSAAAGALVAVASPIVVAIARLVFVIRGVGVGQWGLLVYATGNA
jgi:hypothetical protein